MPGMQGRLSLGHVCAAVVALGVSSGAVGESASLLPDAAFRAAKPCALDPFDGLDATQLTRRLEADCVAVRQRQGLVARQGWARLGKRAETWVGQAMAWGDEGFNARLHWDATARLGPQAVDAHTQLAAGLWWQPDDGIAMNLRLGGRLHEGGVVDHRLSVTSAWRPGPDSLLFTRWSVAGAHSLHEMGVRWWLHSQRVSLDALVPTDVAADEGQARLVLSWRGFRL